MATHAQVAFLRANRDLLTGRALIVGSRMYPYDEADLRTPLLEAGVDEVVGVDLLDGPGVDEVLDIGAPGDLRERRGPFSTVLCMEVLTHVPQPFSFAANVAGMVAPGGALFVSECAVRKLSRMPADNWRFTYDGTKLLYPELQFDDERTRMSLIRDHSGHLLPYRGSLPEIRADVRSDDESALGFLARRAHRKLLARGVFEVSRLLPEVSILSVATRPAAEPG